MATTTRKARPAVRFLFTKLAVFGLAVTTFIWLWAGVAWANRPPSGADAAAGQVELAAGEGNDGAGGKDEEQPAGAAPSISREAPRPAVQQVIIVERQPIQYVTRYAYSVGTGATPPSREGQGGSPALGGGSGTAALPQGTGSSSPVPATPTPAPAAPAPQPTAAVSKQPKPSAKHAPKKSRGS